jgi:hypothetical protein
LALCGSASSINNIAAIAANTRAFIVQPPFPKPHNTTVERPAA